MDLFHQNNICAAVNCGCEVQTYLPRNGKYLKSGLPAAAYNREGGPIIPTFPEMFHVKHFGQNIPALFHVKQKRHGEKCFT